MNFLILMLIRTFLILLRSLESSLTQLRNKYGIIIDIFNFSFQFYVLSFLKLYFMKINRIMKREILSKKNFFIILSIILDMCFFNVFKIIIFIMIREF